MHEATHISHKHELNKDIRFTVITISSSRYEKYGDVDSPLIAQDSSGSIIIELIKNKGYELKSYKLIADDRLSIQNSILNTKDTDIIITSGGTGLSSDDITIESITPLFEKKIEGFGEYFRYLSIEEIGSSVILTRSCAGIINNKIVFCLPGSPNAVRLALSKIILLESNHILNHVNRIRKSD